MTRRPPGYTEDIWRDQAGEKRCQLHELIRKLCPRGEFGYYPPDIDLVIWDEVSETGTIHISIIEKKIIGTKIDYWQHRIYDGISKLIEKGAKNTFIDGKKVIFHGWHKVEIPDNEDYRKWSFIRYDNYEISPEKIVEILNHNPSEPIEGGWKVE